MNELSVKFVNVLGLNPFVRNNSSARQYMFAGHIAQALVINGSTERIIQTGMEQEFGKYTFRTAMPADGRILRIIEKYPQTIGVDNIKINPLTIVIYEDITTGSIGCFSMERFKSFHQHFGFDNNPTENINQIRVGKVIPKDTVFLDSPNIKENGGYAFGLELNLALMTTPGTSEDGIIISRDVLDRMKFKVYERRSVDFGKNSYPLNIYGDDSNYKIFPDIGEYIREDGLLMATRSYNEDLDPTDFNAYSVRNIDPVFDNLTYSRAGRGVVIDIKVLTNDVELGIVPENMCLQINKYLKAQKEYYTQILETEKNLRLESRRKYNQDMLQVTNELHQLIMEALIYTDGYQYKSQYPLSRLYKKKPLDDYKIEFTIEYELTPDIGYKLTDCHGTDNHQ
jgi:DNA-directed RNA polymerase beta subunit